VREDTVFDWRGRRLARKLGGKDLHVL
jgi:hypothetical protein